ncbi:MAG TPA: cation:proton antiporter family protein [Candidatus Limnocylindrales bacterium]
MSEPLALILDLGVAVAVALAGGALARWARQPTIVGYLIAGVAIGPFTPGFVGDIERIQLLSEIGIVLLVFALGIEFTFSELARVRRVAIGAGVLQIAVITVVGTALMLGVGLDLRAGFVVGAVLAISSTLVVVKALEERGELDSLHGRTAIGWMIVQDLATIVFIVSLPPLAEDSPDPGPIAFAALKAALFLALALVAGTRLLPRMFAIVARLGSPELFLLAVFATALLTAFVSSAVFGLSLALGAFVAGVVIAESDLSHQAAAEIIPFRDLFAVLFFVSVGMLLDPAELAGQAPLVGLLVVAGVLGKGAVSVAASAAFGLPLRSAILLGAGIAQVGEFSLILARDATERGVLGGPAYNAILGATIVSIALAGPVRAVGDRLVRRVEGPPTVPAAVGPPTAPMDGAPGRAVAGRIPGRATRSRTEEALLAEGVGRRRVVVAGCGRVGRIVVRAVRTRAFACTVIDRDRVSLDEAVSVGADILYGDAARPEILRRAGLENAQALIVAIGDPLTARLVAERARAINPALMIASRSPGRRHMEELRLAGVQRLASPEAEAAFELARHALQRMGVSGPELSGILAGLRRDAYR